MASRFNTALLAIGLALGLAACGASEDAPSPQPQPPVEQPSAPRPAPSDLTVKSALAACPQFLPPNLLETFFIGVDQRPQALCFQSFAAVHSGTARSPVMVFERLNAALLSDALDEVRTENFYAEPQLSPGDRAELGDYRGSGFDRGHLAPAADMPNETTMAESFSLANIVPQVAEHNRVLWAKIESDTRRYVRRATGDVYVVTGVHYSSTTPFTIGLGVKVPSVLWKLVYAQDENRVWVHWSQNSAAANATAPVTYDEFVARSGLSLLKP